MKDIVVKVPETAETFEFLHTQGLGSITEVRLRGYRRPDAHWRLTAEAQHRRSKDDNVIKLHVPEDEEANTCPRPRVPEPVIKAALGKAGPTALYREWS